MCVKFEVLAGALQTDYRRLCRDSYERATGGARQPRLWAYVLVLGAAPGLQSGKKGSGKGKKDKGEKKKKARPTRCPPVRRRG